MATEKTWTGPKPEKCDLCGQRIGIEFVDGKTIHGPHGIMCKDCHPEAGTGIGPGRGQRYRLVHDARGPIFAKIEG